MPGIAGLITRRLPEWALPQLDRMLGTMRHESSHGTGTWMDASSGVYCGWTVRRNSFADGMPVCSGEGSAVLVFSGEEYSQRVDTTRGPEDSRKTKGPSYLVRLYEDGPSNFLARLNGRFHGLLMDRRQGAVTLFNDRYGMHRLYFYQAKDAFYFAVEAKAILTVCPELRTLDPRSLGEFASCGCVLENRTLFKGMRVLPPGSAWIFRNGALEREGRYFRAQEWEDQAPMEPQAYYRQLRDVFSQNLPRYFNGQERVALSLTGGLDTRMIMAWHKPESGSMPCYSFGGMLRDSQDVAVARRVAAIWRQPHEVITVDKKFLYRFPHYAERAVYLTDGCVGVNHSADLFLNEYAAGIAPVRMTGNYGGEVLRRVRAFRPGKTPSGLFDGDFLAEIDGARKTYAGLVKSHPLSFSVFAQAPWHHYGLLALEQTQLSVRTPFLDNELVQTVYRAPETACANTDMCLRLIAEGNSSLSQIRTDLGLIKNGTSLPATITRRFLEFTFKAEYAYDYGMPQQVARVDHWFSLLHLERLFLGRHKFTHFRIWYRDTLSSYIREMLLDRRTLARPYLNRRAIEPIVLGHIKGQRNYTPEIHKLLTLELINRLFVDGA